MASRDLRIQFQSDADAFAAAAWPLLISDEANHTVLLSALQSAQHARAAGRPHLGTTPWRSAVALQDGELVATTFRSRGNWLLSTGPAAAFERLATALSELGPDADERGIVGPRSSVEAFGRCGSRRIRRHVVMPLMNLTREPDPGPVPVAGHLLPLDADTGDAYWDPLVDWTMAFQDEARLTDPRALVESNLRDRLPQGSLAFWIDADGRPACLIGATHIAPTGARIGPVYTPPERRGRGFARAAVTHGCRRLIAHGARSIFLFTDAANPISNPLYRRIGFELIAEHLHRQFTTDSEVLGTPPAGLSA